MITNGARANWNNAGNKCFASKCFAWNRNRTDDCGTNRRITYVRKSSYAIECPWKLYSAFKSRNERKCVTIWNGKILCYTLTPANKRLFICILRCHKMLHIQASVYARAIRVGNLYFSAYDITIDSPSYVIDEQEMFLSTLNCGNRFSWTCIVEKSSVKIFLNETQVGKWTNNGVV